MESAEPNPSAQDFLLKETKKELNLCCVKHKKEFNPETMQQVSDLPVSEYLNRWLRESVMNLPPETYGRYAYDLGRVVVPYFEKEAAVFESTLSARSGNVLPL